MEMDNVVITELIVSGPRPEIGEGDARSPKWMAKTPSTRGKKRFCESCNSGSEEAEPGRGTPST